MVYLLKLCFLRGEQMCSDDAGNIYIVDQDNHAIRMVNNTGVSTVIGGEWFWRC